MAKVTGDEIRKVAYHVIEEHPDGIRWVDILKAVEVKLPEAKHNTVRGATHKLLKTDDRISKIARGVYQLRQFSEASEKSDLAGVQDPFVAQADHVSDIREEDFYASFAEWLIDNDEATTASVIGGSTLGGKWGTPDVLAVLKPQAGDIFKFAPQIISAEIKSVTGQSVVAFGQAIAYRLFSHKAYVVVPRDTSEDDTNRLKALCSLMVSD